MKTERHDTRIAAFAARRRPSLLPFRWWMFVLLLAVALTAIAAPKESHPEYELKAAFLYNFARFVEWPPDRQTVSEPVLMIGILGKDPFGELLGPNQQKARIGNRLVQVQRFARVEEMGFCHIVFIGASEAEQLPQALNHLEHLPVLTVGESERFSRLGGIICFRIENNKVRFDINVGAADRAGLRISSKLLSLAGVVTGRERGL